MTTNKNLLLIFRHPPFSSSANRETLDIALACATFDIPVSLLFLNDASLQLIEGQQSQIIEQKNLVSTFKALAMYDVTDYYVLATDLERFALSANDLALTCKTLKDSQIAPLIRSFNTVINL